MCHVTSSGTSLQTFVPLAPLISSAASFKSPMMAQAFGFTDPSTKEMAAEIFGPMDMWVAEDFHRQAVATTQQLYLRPEFRVGTSAPVHYMDAIRRDRIRAV